MKLSLCLSPLLGSVLLLIQRRMAYGFVCRPQIHADLYYFSRPLGVLLQANGDDGDSLDKSIKSEDSDNEETAFVQSSVKIDDGGSDLTERFKYKVQALMGNFDPADSTKDTEETSGNILNAMLNFPATYTFHVVGKHAAGAEEERNEFVKEVQNVVRSAAGLRDDEPLEPTVVPRGSKFVKVSISATVESGSMISQVYEELGALPNSVMQF